MKAVTFFCSVCLLSAVPSVVGQQIGRVSPVGWGNDDGNSFYIVPFSASVSSRYQQIYTPQTFVASFPGIEGLAIQVNGISFRTDSPFGHGFSTTLPDIEINLSTTRRAVDGLSPTFADNIGPNDTVMVPRGPLLLQGSYYADQPVQTLTTFIGFGHPFYWDPREGNLLLDVRNYIGQSTAPFDAVDLPNDDVSSIYGLVGDTAGTLSSRGLVTGLIVTMVPVPEPSTLALLAFGVSALELVWKRRNQPKAKR